MNIRAISVPDYVDQVVNKNAINRDIITALNSQFPKAVQQVRALMALPWTRLLASSFCPIRI